MTSQRELLCCLVCGSTIGRDTDLVTPVRRCTACDFGWTRATLAAPRELYNRGADGPTNYLEVSARRYQSDLRLRWLLGTGIPVSLLEVGCAGGFFLEAAAKAGIVATGIDVSVAAVRFARDELGVAATVGSFEEASVADPVEAVCAFSVLEKVEDPHDFLLAARQALAPGGRLAVEVPNIASAAADRLGNRWPQAQPGHQRWHFTPDSLARLITRHGFEVVARDTVFSRFYWRPVPRLAHLRQLFLADWLASRSPKLSHPRLGDWIRLIARRPEAGRAT
jgi:SAM-dependent methyltransferase